LALNQCKSLRLLALGQNRQGLTLYKWKCEVVEAVEAAMELLRVLLLVAVVVKVVTPQNLLTYQAPRVKQQQ
jgi:hypothetical protein|tara:strand:+ start:130 stop:345 length:216 start_codon:yes stop_codon:yes gene_type:complete